MNKRTHNLLDDMQAIFGSFGSDTSLSESELDERKKGVQLGRQQPGGGRVGGKKGGGGPGGSRRGKERPAGGRKRREFDMRSAKKVSRAAAAAARDNPKSKERQKGDEERYKAVMKDIHKDVEKSSKKSSKTRGAEASAGTGGSGGGGDTHKAQRAGKTTTKQGKSQHFPFKRSPNLGPGPRSRHHDETKCWSCGECSKPVWKSGCKCTSSGKGRNCPPKGTVKQIKYKKSYKDKYNMDYHQWRRDQGGRVTARLGATRG
jgi:hypothetical protein